MRFENVRIFGPCDSSNSVDAPKQVVGRIVGKRRAPKKNGATFAYTVIGNDGLGLRPRGSGRQDRVLVMTLAQKLTSSFKVAANTAPSEGIKLGHIK